MSPGSPESREADRTETIPDRRVPPAVGPTRPPTLPEPQRFRLPGGPEVVLVERPGLPLAHLELLVPGGARAAGGRPGLAALAMDLLDEGAAGRTALELAVAAEGIGARLSTGASRDHAWVSVNLLAPQLAEGVTLLADVALRPTFPPGELERVRAERMNAVLQALDDPATRADDALGAILYGAEHPYGAPLLGTGEWLAGFTGQELLAFYREGFRGRDATLLVLGAVTREAVEPLLAEAFGEWAADPGGTAQSGGPAGGGVGATGGAGEGALPGGGALPSPAALAAAREGALPVVIHLVDRPGAPQSEIRVGRVTVHRGHPDEHALVVMNTVLGGSFTSRLMQNLREEKGFTYGAGSFLDLRRGPGPLVALSAVHTPATAPAVAEFVREIRRMADETVPEEELERARSYVALRLPQRFESLEDAAARIGETVLYGLPDGYWNGYVEAIRRVSAAEVRRVAREHLVSGRLEVVVVGDRAEVEGPLRALGLGPVEIVPGDVPGGDSNDAGRR